jgi:tetraacyldisaccharide 4'-kinase
MNVSTRHGGSSPGARIHNWWRRVASGDDDARGLGIILQGLLVLLSVLYGIASSLLLWLRGARPERARVPIVSVGNLTVGGTGKTPLVVHIARLLSEQGREVAIVSRGYGRTGRGTVVVSRGEQPVVPWRKAGDEPYLMALLTKGVSVLAAARRADGIRHAVEKLRADVILLDDAYQHVQLARDLDIVTADARHPVGNGHLLPAGVLREHPLGIGRADLIVATRCDAAGGAQRVARTIGMLAGGAPIVETRMKPVELWELPAGRAMDVSGLIGKTVLALSSIANPGDFERTLANLGIRPAAHVALPDHHRYRRRDFAAIEKLIDGMRADVILTTEKDAVRLADWNSPVPIVALGIEIEILRGEEHLRRALRAAVSGGGTDGSS